MCWLRHRWVRLVAAVIMIVFLPLFFGCFGVLRARLWRLFILVLVILRRLGMVVLVGMLAVLYRLGYVGYLHLGRNADLAMIVLVALLTAFLVLMGFHIITTNGDGICSGCEGQDGNDSGLCKAHDDGQSKGLKRLGL